MHWYPGSCAGKGAGRGCESRETWAQHGRGQPLGMRRLRGDPKGLCFGRWLSGAQSSQANSFSWF